MELTLEPGFDFGPFPEQKGHFLIYLSTKLYASLSFSSCEKGNSLTTNQI